MEWVQQRRTGLDQRGFTLIEVMVAIAILAILASVVVFALSSATKNADIVACKAERRIVVTALEAARLQNVRREYPGVAGPDGLDAVRAAGVLEWGDDSEYWNYVNPADTTGLTNTDLVRAGLSRVSAADC